MNSYRELLAVDEGALRRLRAFDSGVADGQDADVQLIETEIERVNDRLTYWEEMVDGANWRPLQPA
jgi:hypothetical protein